MRHRYFATIAALVGCAGIAVAAEQTILGKSITIKDPKPGVDATKRKVTGSGKEKNSPNTIVGNPTTLGGVLQVFAFGGTPSTQTFLLPQGTSTITGKPFWTAAGSTGFKYKDSKGEQSPVKSVQIKRTPSGTFSIKAKISAKNGAVIVVPPNPGTSACVALQITGGDRYSVDFGPTSQIKNSQKVFKAKKPTAEGICPGAIPTTTTTSTVTTSSSSTSTTLYGSPSKAFFDRMLGLLD
jgi:hypothetical protein